jgi:hypothetical protein
VHPELSCSISSYLSVCIYLDIFLIFGEIFNNMANAFFEALFGLPLCHCGLDLQSPDGR